MSFSDVLLFQTNDDGDINIVNGTVETTAGLETAVYLSLFGGNEDDNGIGDNLDQWWGNIDVSALNRYRSQTQNILKSIPLISGNLTRIQDAINNDLAWLIETGIASAIIAELFIEDVNRLKITIDIRVVNIEFLNTSKFVKEIQNNNTRTIILTWRPAA